MLEFSCVVQELKESMYAIIHDTPTEGKYRVSLCKQVVDTLGPWRYFSRPRLAVFRQNVDLAYSHSHVRFAAG
jgi:hypothetical protein